MKKERSEGREEGRIGGKGRKNEKREIGRDREETRKRDMEENNIGKERK